MNEQNKPSYYAIIPSSVRYCEELKFAERLLYGEITALAGKEGYCFATNKYFADLYKVIPGTISRWISHLENLGFVNVKIIKNEKNQIIERRIYINDIYRDVLSYTYEQKEQYPYNLKEQYPISKINKYNNINTRIDRFFNYIINNKGEGSKIFTEEEKEEFWNILKKLEFDYTDELIKIFTQENIEKLKIIIYSLKELYKSSKSKLINRIKREDIISVYDNCKIKQVEYEGTINEIKNFFEYYYVSLVKSLES